MQKITLDLIPGIYKTPVCYVSQYDKNRQIEIELTENGDPYILTGGELLSIAAETSTGAHISASVENPGGNRIIFNVSQEFCEDPTETICKLIIKDEPQKIGAANFVLQIEPAPN